MPSRLDRHCQSPSLHARPTGWPPSDDASPSRGRIPALYAPLAAMFYCAFDIPPPRASAAFSAATPRVQNVAWSDLVQTSGSRRSTLTGCRYLNSSHQWHAYVSPTSRRKQDASRDYGRYCDTGPGSLPGSRRTRCTAAGPVGPVHQYSDRHHYYAGLAIPSLLEVCGSSPVYPMLP